MYNSPAIVATISDDFLVGCVDEKMDFIILICYNCILGIISNQFDGPKIGWKAKKNFPTSKNINYRIVELAVEAMIYFLLDGQQELSELRIQAVRISLFCGAVVERNGGERR